MNIPRLQITYANGEQEVVPSDLTPEQFFDSRFGGLDEETKAKCKVVVFEDKEVEEAPKPKAGKK